MRSLRRFVSQFMMYFKGTQKEIMWNILHVPCTFRSPWYFTLGIKFGIERLFSWYCLSNENVLAIFLTSGLDFFSSSTAYMHLKIVRNSFLSLINNLVRNAELKSRTSHITPWQKKSSSPRAPDCKTNTLTTARKPKGLSQPSFQPRNGNQMVSHIPCHVVPIQKMTLQWRE